MKSTKHIRVVALCALLLAAALPGKAQIFPNSYINIDWQMNVPLGNSFADKASGWGMNFEGGYRITPAVAVGPFVSYHTNLQNIDRHSACHNSVLQPYIGLKLGASYSEFSSYYYVIKQYDDSWGFYMSPELGVSIFPNPTYRFGLHLALYYSYATNSGSLLTYKINNLSNFGVRVGISF